MTNGPIHFQQQKVISFESRRASQMERLIEKYGGVPWVSPSMREVARKNPAAAVRFGHQVITAQVDDVIFTTGVGFTRLLESIEQQIDQKRFLDCLQDIVTIARGPKTTNAMRKVGIVPTYVVPPPNTWRETLTMIDQSLSVDQHNVVLLEYGISNSALIAGLEARGAKVMAFQVYDWELPEDLAPLKENIHRIIRGEAELVLFTSAHQLRNVLQVADDLDLLETFQSKLSQVIIGSIGPSMTEALQSYDLPVHFEPTESKMAHLVLRGAKYFADQAP